MEEGSLRCDANVSVRPVGAAALGTKAEVKNVNSFRYLQKAIDYEIARQIDVVDHGGRVVQETRLFDAALGKTFSMRSKEEAHDYRYFPEPDLPPLRGRRASAPAAVAAALPELPEARRARFVAEYRLPAYDAAVLTESRPLADYFEAVGRAAGNAKAASNWVMGEVLRTLKARGATIEPVGVSADGAGRAHPPGRRRHHQQHRRQGGVRADGRHRPRRRRHRRRAGAGPGLRRRRAVAASSRGVLAAHADAVQQYRNGKKAAFGFLVGEAMKASSGQADPRRLSQLLRAALDG